MKKIVMCGIIAAAILTAGCTQAVPPPATPSPTLEVAALPPLPVPVATVQPAPNVLPGGGLADPPRQTDPEPCGQEVTVKVGKMEVNMPKGGSLEIDGAGKASTTSYHILLEGVEFTTHNYCR